MWRVAPFLLALAVPVGCAQYPPNLPPQGHAVCLISQRETSFTDEVESVLLEIEQATKGQVLIGPEILVELV